MASDGKGHPDNKDLTVTLQAAADGNSAAANDLALAAYEDLRRRADRLLLAERADHTLQPTALVNEAYIQLIQRDRINWAGKTHFYAVAAEAMRRILIDHARAKGARKRGGNQVRVALTGLGVSESDTQLDLLDVAEALEELAARDSRAGRIVELRLMGGLTEKETGQVLGLAERTIRKEWAWAKVWLRKRLNQAGGDD